MGIMGHTWQVQTIFNSVDEQSPNGIYIVNGMIATITFFGLTKKLRYILYTTSPEVSATNRLRCIAFMAHRVTDPG